MGDQEDAVSLADHLMTHLYLPGMPVSDTRTHDGHAQLGIVGVVQLPVEERVTECTGSSRIFSSRKLREEYFMCADRN